MTRILLAGLMLLGLSVNAQNKISSDDLKELRNRMEGSFDTEEQSKTDPSYARVNLNAREIDIKGLKNGYLVYVEQEMPSPTGSAYHQRVYHIFKHDKERIAAKTYELNDPARFIGAWREADAFKKLTMDSLVDRQGCFIYITKDDRGNFVGSTSKQECTNDIQGAVYSTSELFVGPNMFIIWDRGWNAAGEQTWGAQKGGYRFRKFTISRNY
jgi:hypothetical protein